MRNDNALILFVKAPRIGTVKTRLQPELTPAQSLQLYRAMAEDTVKQADGSNHYDLKIYFYPADALKEMKDWLGSAREYFPQHGSNLGSRMRQAIAEIAGQNYKKAVLAGSDIPALDTAAITRAFSGLKNADLVLGPGHDGGYYLIGMKQPHPELFENISWSTRLVYQQTIQKAKTLGLHIIQMERKTDIDTFTDAEKFWKSLKKRNLQDSLILNSKTGCVLKTLFEGASIFYSDANKIQN